MRKALFAAAAAMLLSGSALAAEPVPYEDPARGFKTVIPEGWSNPAGGLMTQNAAQTITCTFTIQPNPQTASKDQETINRSLAVYTADVWKQQFFTGGTTGSIEVSGITRLEAYDAPWARGLITYPGRELNKFGVLLLAGPGKIVSGICLGEPAAYNDNIYGIGKVLNYLRPM